MNGAARILINGERRGSQNSKPTPHPQRLTHNASARSCWAAKVREDIKKREPQWQN